jgi:hypothetical protein
MACSRAALTRTSGEGGSGNCEAAVLRRGSSADVVGFFEPSGIRRLAARQGPQAGRIERILATSEGKALYRRRQQIVGWRSHCPPSAAAGSPVSSPARRVRRRRLTSAVRLPRFASGFGMSLTTPLLRQGVGGLRDKGRRGAAVGHPGSEAETVLGAHGLRLASDLDAEELTARCGICGEPTGRLCRRPFEFGSVAHACIAG